MQQFASSYYRPRYYRPWILPVLLILLLLALTACGGDGGSSGGGGSSNTLTILVPPAGTAATSASVNFGEVQALRASLVDSSGAALPSQPSITWTTDAPALAGVTANGAFCGDSSTLTTCVCGGGWQNSNVDCVPPTANGTATVTAKASSGETATIKVFVHPRISRVAITTAPVTDCTSSTGTLQLTAQAFDINNNPVTVGSDATAFSWTTSDSTVATVDTKGLVTSANPGKNNIFAAVGGHISSPYGFSTCGVKSIHIHVKDSADTSLTVNTSVTTPLAADVVDTKGQSITLTGSRLLWTANQSGIVTVDQAGGVTSVGAGSSGIVATCSPPFCNSGFTSVFSNVLTVNVNGTTTTQVLATNSAGTSLVPIDTSTNTAGTAITLPSNPNSIVYAGNGSKAYLGSSSTLMVFDPATSTVSSLSGLPGIVMAVSNNAQFVVLYDPAANTITIADTTIGSPVVQRFSVSGIPNPCSTSTSNKCPKASFTPDNRSAYIVAGTNLYVFNNGASLRIIALGTTGNDVASTAQGSFAFVANSDATVVPYATCNNAKVTSNVVTLGAAAQELVPSLDGTTVYAVAPPNLNIISPTTDGVSPTTDLTGCVPSLADPFTTVDLGQGAFNLTLPIISSNGNRLYFLTGGNTIVVYDKASNAGSSITLASSANAVSGGLTADGANLYVGGSDNNVHRIDTSTNTDAGQISVSFTPDLVAVRPK